MQTITVDMTPGFRQPTIHYSQNDVGTTFAIDLRSRFGDTLPASPTVKIQATKPSGFGFSIEADSVVDSVATFTTVDTMTDEAGRFLAELEVSDSGVVLYTANFYMEGEANPHPIGTTDGSQETIIPTLTLLVERVETVAASVLDMTVEAETLAAGSQATYSYDEDTNTATFGIPQGEAGAGAAGVTASAYSSSKTYAVGDYVIHNSNLYRCTTAITTAEAFTAAHWTQVVLGNDVCDLKSAFNEMDLELFNTSISLNRFNASLVTSETIFANKQLTGSGTLVDNTNTNVSPYLEIEPNKEYTMGLVPKYGSAFTPWYTLPTAIAFYDSTKTFISHVDSTTGASTFTTPNNAKYYRFNIYRSVGIVLPILSLRCMLVYGDALPSSFSEYTGDSKTPKYRQPIGYSLSSGILTVTSKYGDGSIVVEFGRRGPNNLPDFRYITADGRQKYNNSTDWFGPFVLEALSNIDGDDINNSTYTGGNHNYNNTGTMDSTATARNLSLSYYADGKSLSDGDSGFCASLEIAWRNRVQAFNTRKADGTGREVLEERHTLKFDGTEWEAYIEIEALENIFCRQYYGLQCAVTNYPIIHMIGATYRKSFQYTSPHDSGNNAPNIYVAHDSNDRLEMEVDRSLDLGTGNMYGSSGTQGFRTAGSKGYTYFITQKNLDANDIYGARGWYRFMPSY